MTLLVVLAYTSPLLFHAKSRYKRAEFVGCYLALTMFVFMLYILFEVLAYFFILAGSANPRGAIIHGGYMLGRCL